MRPIEAEHFGRDEQCPAHERSLHSLKNNAPALPVRASASRGSRPRRVLPAALSLARQRGSVQQSRISREALYHFTILTGGLAAFVRARFAPDILATLPEIAKAYEKDLRRLRAIVQDRVISRELWLRSRHGTFRFFRVTAEGLVELDREGNVLAAESGAGRVAG
jgi:hypothetical protein